VIPLLTARGYSLSALAFFAIAISSFFYIPYIAIASLPISVFLIVSRLFNKPHTKIAVSRDIEKRVVLQGDEVTIRLTVRNEYDSIAIMKIEDSIPKNVKVVEGSNIFIMQLKKGESKSFTYSVSPFLPGKYVFNEIKTESFDPFQLFVERKIITIQDEVRAYPFVETNRNSMIIMSLRNQPGENRSRRQGEGEEFYSVRDYVAGDRLKRINWKASARYQTLHTNQYAAELAGELMVILDSRFALLPKEDEEEQFKKCSSAAATIAYSAILSRNKVGLMVMGDLLEKVPPAYGYRQLRKILTALSDFSAGRRWQISKVDNYLRLLFPKVQEIALVTPIVDDEVLKALYSLHEDGFNSYLVAPDIWSSRLKKEEQLDRIVATRIFILKRRENIERARRFAIVVDWDVDKPLTYLLRLKRIEQRSVLA
jgi:uncharacterized protein (DUF58 family)